MAGRIENLEPVLQAVAGEQFFNTSPLDFKRLLDDPANTADNLRAYIAGFSEAARDVIEKFDCNVQITAARPSQSPVLVISRFARPRPPPTHRLEPRDGLRAAEGASTSPTPLGSATGTALG